ncbi:MAG: hypothetical protein PHS02_02555 [Candidatus ainarchaeum sp.]|nr:hypothetical protein [Candidatus ainarchaeum sp.]
MRFQPFLPIIASFLLLGCLGSQQYENKFKGFSTVYPAGWSVYEDEVRVVFSSPNGAAQLIVFSTYSNSSASPDNVTRSLSAQFVKSHTDIAVINQSSRNIIVDNLNASESSLHFSYASDSGRIEQYSRFAAFSKGEHYFIVLLNVFSAPGEKPDYLGYDKTLEMALSDFKIL